MDTRSVGHAPYTDAKDIEAALLKHPHVRDAVVQPFTGDAGERRSAAYLVADLAKLKSLQQIDPTQASEQMVHRWSKLYEVTYSTAPVGPSFVGWSSSYTRQPIPDEQMQEWLQATLRRIRTLNPRRVLDIGCGVGLLLQHLAPQCNTYVGTDFSTKAIARLREWMRGREDLKHVELLQRTAMDIQDMKAGSFDTVVLSSVVQYFPSIEYLLGTLERVIRLLSPGGKIFLGDLRNLRLLPTFYITVQLGKATDSTPVREVMRRVSRAAMQETELAIDPEFFEALPRHLPGISGVEVQLRRGRAQNEMTRYRYDVVLHTDEQLQPRAVYEVLRWQTEDGFLARVEEGLKERRWHALELCSVPNLRLARDAMAGKLIEASDKTLTVHTLLRELDHRKLDGVDPETFWQWGDSYGYDVSVGWSPRESPECFEVRFLDRQHPQRTRQAASPVIAGHVRPWTEYANDPLENRIGREFILQLHEYLRPLVQEAVIPSEWTLLKQLPRGPQGDIDRHAL
jgi:ubiquinone/menaquinone biosynthesis C-methylase UbiE